MLRRDQSARDAAYVNAALSARGFDAPFALLPSEEPRDTKAREAYLSGLRTLSGLLDAHERQAAAVAEAESRARRLAEDLAVAEGAGARHAERLAVLEAELRALHAETRAERERVGRVEAQARGAGEEAARLRAVLATRERAHAVDVRRRDRDFERVRDQLAVVLRDGAGPAVLENAVYAPAGAYPEPEAEGPERADVLEHENANLRQLVASVSHVLREIRTATGDAEAAAGVSEAYATSAPVSWAYDALKADIEGSLSAIADRLGL